VDTRSDIIVKIAVKGVCAQQLVAQVEYVGCEEKNAEKGKDTGKRIFIFSYRTEYSHRRYFLSFLRYLALIEERGQSNQDQKSPNDIFILQYLLLLI
jgi:hypothetical protein